MSFNMRNLGGTGSSNPQGQRRLFRRRTHLNNENRFGVEAIGAFKLTPSFQPHHFSTHRPVMGVCCACVPRSKKVLFTPEMKDLGMRNILDLKTEVANAGLLARWFPVEAFALRRPLFEKFPDPSKDVLTSPRVLNAIESTAERLISKSGATAQGSDISKQIIALEKQGWKLLKKMKASVSSVFIKFTAWFLLRFLAQFLQSVQVCKGQMRMIKDASQRGVPMIYLPLHRSHMDYILVTLILWNFDIRAPYVAAGENMDIPFFGLLMRGLGGFFIRRRLDTQIGQKDLMYRAILHEYMTKLLSSGEGLEFFIEGGRTRTGRAVIPKGGLLSVVVEACNEGSISDAYIVPVTFSYEKIIDGNFCKEQMGLKKVGESFFGAIKAILQILYGNYGSVRVDFAQPFSLREFLNYTKENPYHPLTSPAPPSKNQIDFGSSYPNFSQTILSTDSEAEQTRMMVKALADHTVYTSDHCTAPMSTHLVAFLLLTKYRQGVYMRELTKAIHWIVRELQALSVDVGFCGKSEDIVMYAQCLLGDHLISRSWQEENNDFRVNPVLSLPAVFELSYYASHLTTHFSLEGILAAAIMQASGLSLFQLLGSNPIPKKKVSREDVLDTAEELCIIIHNEFIFLPPCGNISLKLSELLETFVSKEIVYIEENQVDEMAFAGKDRQWATRLALSLDVDEDSQGAQGSPQDLMVNVERSDIRERLHFLVSTIGPILESHFVVAKFALDELSTEWTEEEFIKSLGAFSQRRVEEDMSLFSESCALLNLKSAVKSFQDLEILYSYKEANLSMIGLSEQIDARSTLEHYLQLLQASLA